MGRNYAYSGFTALVQNCYYHDSCGATATSTPTPTATSTAHLLWGDADCSRAVTAADASMILRYLVELDVLSEVGRIVAGMNGDTLITAADAAKILRHLVELEHSLVP